MRNNPIQFAVVREDPLIEAEVVSQHKRTNLLMVGSGGCSALSLGALFPDLEITAFDFNLAQIQLAQTKNEYLTATENFNKVFNIEDASPEGLNQCGNFESLFKGFREFIFDFILKYDQMRCLFSEKTSRDKIESQLINHRYWSVAFDLFFHDSLLRMMFGDAAIQHAPHGSYPKYFQRVFEEALLRQDASQNYFLHHVLLGHYLDDPHCLPPYLIKRQKSDHIQYIHGDLKAIPALGDYDFIQLSNIMDWMDVEQNREIGHLIHEYTTPGTVVLIRQLNNAQPVLDYFPNFKVDESLSETLLAQDRSIFYSTVLCLIRQ